MCATIDSSRYRRILLRTVFVFFWFVSSPRFLAADPPAVQRPNVLVIITDDQGYGDLSCHGNPVLKTPNLDRLHAESVRFTDFHVAPMCTPTRGQLLTGVDALRNGAVNVSSGRTMLRRDLPTMADIFAASGYRTGLFGKWHLGDAYPYRPQDRGFHESLWFPSSHIGSVPDAWQNDYFNDGYLHNGRWRTVRGYTTDALFREAMQWMKTEASAGQPFFCYLATASPHQPHFVPDRYRRPIRAAIEAAEAELENYRPDDPLPWNRTVGEELVSFLAMIANIDENVGRLEAFLVESGLRDNTLVLFLTDNGSTFGPRYFNAGMRGGKVTLWEGGHRVPCFVRWPAGGLRSAGDMAGLVQVQDLLPTLIELLDLTSPPSASFDGISLAPTLRGQAVVPDERMLVINYSRMPFKATRTMPQSAAVPRREGAAVLWKNWRLLEDRQLYDLAADPLQQQNVIDAHPEIAAAMREHLDAWPVASARLRVGDHATTSPIAPEASSVGFMISLPAGRTTLQTALLDAQGNEIAGAYYVTAEWLRPAARRVKLILDTDMSGDADDAGTLALLHALADRGECELLATVTNRRDKTNASAAAVDAINTYYGRPDLPIGTDKQGPTDLQRTSPYTEALRDGFPNDIGPDDQAPDALDVYRQVLAKQPDGSVTICSVGALSNLAELCRSEPELVRAKVGRLVVMGGEFPDSDRPETNIRTHREAAQVVAAQWPGEIVWHGFEIGQVLITGEQLKWTPRGNPVRRAYELRQHRGRPSIEGGQPSYDQAAALFAVRGAEPEFWGTVSGGQVIVDGEGRTVWHPDPNAKHTYVKLAGDPEHLAAVIESLMIAPPKNRASGECEGNES